jgi:hypothetical protein
MDYSLFVFVLYLQRTKTFFLIKNLAEKNCTYEPLSNVSMGNPYIELSSGMYVVTFYSGAPFPAYPFGLLNCPALSQLVQIPSSAS